jgi:hypothetical protein
MSPSSTLGPRCVLLPVDPTSQPGAGNLLAGVPFGGRPERAVPTESIKNEGNRAIEALEAEAEERHHAELEQAVARRSGEEEVVLPPGPSLDLARGHRLRQIHSIAKRLRMVERPI